MLTYISFNKKIRVLDNYKLSGIQSGIANAA